MISATDFATWKAEPVTKAFFEVVQGRIEEAKELLSTSAGADPLYDRWLVGFISSNRDILNVKFDDDDREVTL